MRYLLHLYILCIVLIFGHAKADSNKLSTPLEHCQAVDQVFTSQALSVGPSANWLIPYRVFLPKGYTPDKHYSVVYFLHGRNGNRFLLDSLDYCQQLDLLVDQKNNSFIAVAPEGQSSYWMNGALTHLNWGDAITQELVKDVEKKLPVFQEPKGRLIAGISMGGHGAIQLSLNYPGIYGAVAAHSPVFRTQEEASRDFYFEFGTGPDFQHRDPFSLMIILGKKMTIPIWMDIGGSDPWLLNTQNFANLLISQNLDLTLNIGNDRIGGHAWEYWHYHLPTYLQWYSMHIKKSQ
jgi:S-formylglutathione hydrolase FrmB